MTSGLRKAHKYVWLLLIIIVPIVMIFSIKDLDILSLNQKTSTSFKSSKKPALKTAENGFIKASLYENTVEIILKSPLKSSSAIIYSLKDENKSDIIGQVSSVGVYSFKLKEPIKAILLFDEIKNEDITQLALK